MNNDFRILFEAVIDNSSLTDAQKKIAKQHFKADLSLDLDLNEFAKQKKNIKEQTKKLTEELKTAFKNAKFSVDDKEIESYTKDFLNRIQQATKEQEKLNKAQKQNKLAEQEKYYKRIIENNKAIYALKEKKLSADKEEGKELQRQINNLEKRNKRAYDSISQKKLGDTNWGQQVSTSERELKNRLAIKEARLKDKAVAQEQSLIDKQVADYHKQEEEYLKLRAKYLAEGKKQETDYYNTQALEAEKAEQQAIANKEKAYQDAYKELKKLYDLRIEYAKIEDPDNNQKYLYENAISKQEGRWRKAYANTSEPENWDVQKRLELERQEVAMQERLVQVYDRVTEAKKKAQKVEEINLSITDKSYEAEIAKLTNGFRNLSGDINEAKTHTESLNKAYRAMIDATDDNARLEAEKQYQLELSKTKNLLTIAQAEAREYVDALKVSKLRNDIQDWLKKNTAATKEAKDAMKTYLEMLDDVDGVSQATFNTVKGGMDDWDTKMRQAGKLGKSLTETFKEGAKSFIEWTVSSFSVMEVVQGFKKMGQAVYEIDTAMTNLYKVTDETSQRYDRFLDSTTGKAQELGRTVSSLVEQTANWSKLGFSLDEAENLAQISSIYANVGEVSDDTAVSDMVTAMKAFNIEASDAITIVDMLNTLGNKYATSAADLGAGLSRSASAMATAGTDIEKTLAMLTGGAEITQSAEEFGNMLKIGSMRVRGMKGELEALGEEVDENVESISKMQTQVLNLTHGKVNIFNDNGEFKDYYDIMEGVAKIYSDLSSTEQASLSEILFGKQRGNQGAALIQAFQSGQIQKAYADIQDSAGSAYEEQARWMESLEAKTAQFEAAFQSLSNTILDSDLLKWFVDFGTGSVNALDWVIDKLGTLGTIGVIGGAFGIGKFVKDFA